MELPITATTKFSTWPEIGRPKGYFDLPLTNEAVDFYKENGFLVVENCLDSEDVETLRHEATSICRGERGTPNGLTAASPDETDEEVLRRYLCIHFPHKMSQVMTGYVAHPSYVEILTKLIGPNVKSMQSMMFIKASGKPGQAWHQDEYYIPTRDRSLVGGWIAMDDATVENGCLWVLPGSHRAGVLYPQHQHQDRRFDCAGEAFDFPYRDEDAVPVEVKAGSIVFFHGHLLHRSLPNRAKSGFRRCLVNHYMSCESLLPWMPPKEGEGGMATADFRDIILIAGKDPYAYKGIKSISQPHVRPSGEGGCGDPRHNVKKADSQPSKS